MTAKGGAYGMGTVFKMDSSGAITTLHSFGGTDGSGPYGSLIQASDGYFYGMMPKGGVPYMGTVFKMDASGVLQTLHSFDGTDGSHPQGSLIQASDGFFYGMTSAGGANGRGTVFVSFDFATVQQTIVNLRLQNTQLEGQVSTLTSEKAELQTQLDQLNGNLSAGLISVQNDFRTVFKDPDFALPGSTPVGQLQNLIQAILNMTRGEKNPIYQGLRIK
jgi:uncharacterized repeat protein (TIGR03803 family)